MKKGDHKIISEEILDGEVATADLASDAVTKAKIADEVVEKVILSAPVPASDTFKWLADGAYTIVHVSFHNYGGADFTAAASVTNAGSTVASSSATLGADAVEEKESTDLSNTSVADGAEINLNAGDQNTFIVVVMTKKVNT